MAQTYTGGREKTLSTGVPNTGLERKRETLSSA